MKDPGRTPDEAEAYMRRMLDEDDPPAYPIGNAPGDGGWTAYGEHPSAAEETRLEQVERQLELESEKEGERWRAWRGVLGSEHGSLFDRKAAELEQSDSTVVRSDRGEIQAKMLRFADGSAVLEIVSGSMRSRGVSRMRVDPEVLALNPLRDLLIDSFLQLGYGVRPYDD